MQLAIGLILFTFGARLIPAAEAALISLVETVLGAFWVFLFLGENPGIYALYGGALVLGRRSPATRFTTSAVPQRQPTERRLAMTPRHTRASLRALGPFAAGYFTSYLFRVVNAAISDDLIAELALSKTDLGVMTSMYLYGFVLFQLPLGLPPRSRSGRAWCKSCLLLVAALGAAWFALGDSTASLAGARLLIGSGFGGCLMSAFKANAVWLPPERLALGQLHRGHLWRAGLPRRYLSGQSRCRSYRLAGLVRRAGDLHPCRHRRRSSSWCPSATTIIGRLPWPRSCAAMSACSTIPIFWRVAPMVAAISGTFIAMQTLWATRWMGDVLGSTGTKPGSN